MSPLHYSSLTIALLIACHNPAFATTDTLSPTFQSPMLAQVYQPAKHIGQTFLLSEKYDGIRAFWTGKQLVTRSGNLISAPPWFTAGLPDFALDGELWVGYGQFHQIQSLLHQQQTDEQAWRKARYMVFDRPQAQISFQQRYQALRRWFTSQSPNSHIQLVKHRDVHSQQEINQAMQQVTQRGGEGVILRDPQGEYVNGRDIGMLKFKPFADDEATVIGYRPGKGKYQGQLGALVVRNRSNQVFAIGSGLSDEQRAQPPELGSIITYRYQGTTHNGKPRFARFLRIRLIE